jgi:outer membrane protein assembly factor BamB/tetratricopeptide (TPR) repeat protein
VARPDVDRGGETDRLLAPTKPPMALRGDLASVDLAQVFQMLALNKKVGLLSIHSAKLWKVLYFDQRGVTAHHNVHTVLDRVVAAFVRTGRLSEEAVDEVRDHAVRMAQPLSDSLLAGGYLDEAELDEQYRVELEEEIYDLFFCNEAKFEFHENTKKLEGRDGTVDERFFFNCDSIIMEAARRIDEWAYISERIPSTAEILVATADLVTADDFGNDGPAIFELLDGRRNVARIVEITGLTTFLVCKTLSQLLDAQAIAPVAHEELVALGDECMSEGRLPDAISLYERAIDLGLGLPQSHALAAKAYQAAEEYELAIFHLESEAEHRIGQGDLKGAAACLFEVKNLLPTDLSARERLVELTIGPDAVKIDGFDAMTEGKELVDLLTDFGDIQRVRVLLERLLLVEPNDPDLKKALVNVHVRAGDQKRVVQLYESIADDLVHNGKPLEAVAYLQKILQLDRSRSDISERVRRLYEFDERTRRRGRAMSALAVLFCLLLVLGSGYWFYNERAEEDFAKIDVQDLMTHDDFAGAKAAYASFILAHPLTTAISKANAELQKVESAQQVFEARRNSERAALEAALKKLRDRYRAEWARHKEQFRAGQPEAALVTLEAARKLLAEADQPADMEWALGQQVELNWKNLVEYLAESKRLGAAYDEKIAQSDWAGAREVALRLQAEFENTESGQRVRVPVLVVTRPAGAQLTHDGKPLMRTIDGEEQPLVTPGLVLCQANQPVKLTAILPGFAPREIVVNGKETSQVDAVLEVVPAHTITFDAPAQTGAGAGDGWLAVGLRGGRIGFARADGSNRQVRELGGLKAVDSVPVIHAGRIFFVSNEQTVECVAVDPTIATTGWPAQLTSQAATGLVVGDGRIALVDVNGVLHCWEQATGRRIWGVSLGSPASGTPRLERRRAYVGTVDGRVMVFDAGDGKSLGVLRSPVGLTTGIEVAGNSMFFGCADGAVRAVDFEAGKVLWTADIGRTPSPTGISLSANSLLVAGEGRVLSLDLATGNLLGEMPTADLVQSIQTQGSRAFIRVRRPSSRALPVHDVLVACATDTATVLWEYVLPSIAPGALGVDRNVVALPSESGELVVFR